MKYLELIRYKNILMIVVILLAMRYLILQPMLGLNNLEFQFSTIGFFLLVFATASIAAAGYIINDYFDVRIDLINREKTIIIQKKIPAKKALNLYYIINFSGLIAGFIAAYLADLYKLGFIFLLVAGLLWYYSTTYKRMFLVGNLIISFLAGLTPIMVSIFDIPMLNKHYLDILLANHVTLNYLFYWTLAFGVFAFLSTLAREIIKDMEDMEGDSSFNRKTLPIAIGFRYSKLFVSALILFIIGSIYYVYSNYLDGVATLLYLSIAIVAPFVYIIYKTHRANSKKDYTLISKLIKIQMLIGTLYSVVFYFVFTYTINN